MSEEIDLEDWLPVSPTAPFREIRAEINQQLVKLGKLDPNDDIEEYSEEDYCDFLTNYSNLKAPEKTSSLLELIFRVNAIGKAYIKQKKFDKKLKLINTNLEMDLIKMKKLVENKKSNEKIKLNISLICNVLLVGVFFTHNYLHKLSK